MRNHRLEAGGNSIQGKGGKIEGGGRRTILTQSTDRKEGVLIVMKFLGTGDQIASIGSILRLST